MAATPPTGGTRSAPTAGAGPSEDGGGVARTGGPGDPTGEVAAAWQGKELFRTVFAADGAADARRALARFYHWADSVGVPELSRLTRTVRAWETTRPRTTFGGVEPVGEAATMA